MSSPSMRMFAAICAASVIASLSWFVVAGDFAHAEPQEDAGNPAPGTPSDVSATGWGGRTATVTYVEGAGPNAPLRIEDKPRPQGDWYVNGRPSAPSSLNYYATNEGAASSVTGFTLGRLLGVDPDRPPDVVPALATSWETSEDKLTYTYHLRRGVQFADGRPFTSADVQFSYDTLRDPAVRADHLRGDFDDLASLTTPDPHTVVVKYSRRYWKGLFVAGYTLRVLNKAWYEEQIPLKARALGITEYSTEPGKAGFGEVFNEIRIPCPGTGPYYLAARSDFTPTHIDLVQNPFYYGIQTTPERYNFVKMRWQFIRGRAVSMIEAFKRRQIDIVVAGHDHWERVLRNDEDLAKIAEHYVYDHTGLHAWFIAWNCRRAPFDDARVRRAMTHLINRPWLLREINRGYGQPAFLPSKPSYKSYSRDLKAKEYDPAKAVALLKAAGWSDTDGDGVLDKDGKPFDFELIVPSGGSLYLRLGGLLEDACKEVGIRMVTRPLAWSSLYPRYVETHDFDAASLFHSWSDPWIDNHESFHSSEDVPGGGNASGWRNAESDRLLERMREEFDDDARNALFHEFNRLYYEEQPETLLVHGLVGILLNRRFEGVRVRPTGMQMFDFWVKPENVLHR